MTAHLTVFQRGLARRLRAKGMSLREIYLEIATSPPMKSKSDISLIDESTCPNE